MRLLMTGLLLAPLAQASTDDLMSIYRDALKTNPQIQAAQAAVRSAEFDRVAAEAGLEPSVSATGDLSAGETLNSSSPARPEGGSASTSGTLTARLAIWGPAETAGIEAAKAGTQLAQVSAQSTLDTVELDIAQAYLDLLSAQAALDAAQAQEQAVARQLERAEKRLEVGLGTRVEVDQTQAAYDNVVVALIRAQDAVADAQDSLSTLAQRDIDDIAVLSPNYAASIPSESLESVIQTATQNSVQVRIASEQADLARAQLKLAQAGKEPRLDASASYSTDKNLKGGSWGSGYSGRLTLTLPLHTGGKVEADIASAMASLDEAQANLENALRGVRSQARSLYRALVTQAKTVRAQAQSIKSAETAVEATQAAFDVGSGDIIDVLNAQSDLNNAQSNYAQSRHQHAALVLQLEQLKGELDEADLSALNDQLTR